MRLPELLRKVGRQAVPIVLVATLPVQVVAQADTEPPHFVDVLGSPTRVLTLGLEQRRPGEPIILLQSGAGAALEGWGDWPAALSELAPVVGYDRPGLGQSVFDGVDPTPQRVAAHAHELLDVLEVEPPYILVGHSWGGPLILYFAAEYPDEVVGMVYVDPADPRIPKAELFLTDDVDEIERRSSAYREAVAALGSASMPAGRAAENRVRTDFDDRAPEDRSVPADPDVPTAIVVTTRTPSMAGAPYYINEAWFREYHRVRVGRFVDWSKDRPATTLLLSSDAGHFVHLDDPLLATAAVQQVLAASEAPPKRR